MRALLSLPRLFSRRRLWKILFPGLGSFLLVFCQRFRQQLLAFGFIFSFHPAGTLLQSEPPTARIRHPLFSSTVRILVRQLPQFAHTLRQGIVWSFSFPPTEHCSPQPLHNRYPRQPHRVHGETDNVHLRSTYTHGMQNQKRGMKWHLRIPCRAPLPLRRGLQANTRIVDTRAKEACLAETTPHNVRRTLAGDLMDKGFDVLVVQRTLGHFDPQDCFAVRQKVGAAAATRIHVPFDRVTAPVSLTRNFDWRPPENDQRPPGTGIPRPWKPRTSRRRP